MPWARQMADEQVTAVNLIELILLHAENADIEAAHAAGQLGAHVQVDRLSGSAEAYPAGKERHPVTPQLAEREDIHVLQEEIPLLLEEETEASQVDTLVVHFGRREVRVERQYTRQ